MRVLVLTSIEARHAYLVQRLVEEGFDVLAWAEEKGKSLNQDSFSEKHQSLLDLHTSSLGQSFASFFSSCDLKRLPLEIFQRGIFSDTALIDSARNFAPDVVISYGSGIIGEPLLNLFDQKIIGSHQGLPQYYRGSGANFFAFANQQANYMGISVHFLDKGIDTGVVISQQAPAPSATDTYYSFSASLVHDTIQLYIDVVDQIKNTSIDHIRSQTDQLPFEGKLYQRKDFTPHILQEALAMQLKKSFLCWHNEAQHQLGPPILL